MPRPERPLDTGDEPLLTFARDLLKLREAAGSPPCRQLARTAHYSAARLSDADGGKTLPSLAVTLAYAGACGGDLAEREQRWRQTHALLTLANAVPDGTGDVSLRKASVSFLDFRDM
jgi:hypothetical protein